MASRGQEGEREGEDDDCDRSVEQDLPTPLTGRLRGHFTPSVAGARASRVSTGEDLSSPRGGSRSSSPRAFRSGWSATYRGCMNTQRPPAVITQGLTKRYGGRAAVDNLSLEVPAGVVAGFIGQNGAGKTTTMAMLLGLVTPSAGNATVLGTSLDDPASYLRRVGALIETPAFWPGLTGIENLRVAATLGGHDPARIPEVLDLVGLRGRGGDRFGQYSLGMKQRLGIAAALLGEPELLVLDEPTNG